MSQQFSGNNKSYVLRAGRATPAQIRSYNTLAGQFIVPYKNSDVNFREIFLNDNPVIVEIGFGMGAATAAIAAAFPDINYLGIEVHKPGIGKLLWEIEHRQLSNVKIVEHDAVEVFENMIPSCSLVGIHAFFPDPWPKKRHHKRRLVQRPFTTTLAAKLQPGGYLYMVTDWEDYGLWALAELSMTEGLTNSCGGFALPQEWRPRTRFEIKGLEKNHTVKELYFLHSTTLTSIVQ